MTKRYISSEILSQAGAINAISLRIGGKPGLFSMKRNGTQANFGVSNRVEFFQSLGFDEISVVHGEQVHGDNIRIVEKPGNYSQTDGLVTRNKNLLLSISVADCVPILIADKKSQTFAAVHAGWRGTVKQIAGKAIEFMCGELACSPQNIFAFIGPSAGVCCYEVGEEVAGYFRGNEVSRSSKPGKFMLDLKTANFSQLVDHGVPKQNIEVSNHCTICDTNFHSYRRDGDASGRMLAVIGLATGK